MLSHQCGIKVLPHVSVRKGTVAGFRLQCQICEQQASAESNVCACRLGPGHVTGNTLSILVKGSARSHSPSALFAAFL